MIGVIGGTGLYEFLDEAESVQVDTPYGPTSDAITRGMLGSREVAFLARHGNHHQLPPHLIPYRANIWALKSLGVTQVLAPCAVGSLQAAHGPGCFVVPDQLVDRTAGRTQSFVSDGMVHVSFANPYCPVLRRTVVAAGVGRGIEITDRGTVVVIEGPRFSTRAESLWYAAQGWDLVNMTGHPEAVLAREMAMCYATVALVTDMDAGVGGGAVVTQDEAVRTFRANTERMRAVLVDTISRAPREPDCMCSAALDGMAATHLP